MEARGPGQADRAAEERIPPNLLLSCGLVGLMMDTLTISTQPLLLSAADAARILGIGKRHFYGLHSSGKLGPLPISLGRRTLWRREELEAWVRAGCPARQEWNNVDSGGKLS